MGRDLEGYIDAPWLIEERPGVVLAALWMEDQSRLLTAAANAIRPAAERQGMEASEPARTLGGIGSGRPVRMG